MHNGLTLYKSNPASTFIHYPHTHPASALEPVDICMHASGVLLKHCGMNESEKAKTGSPSGYQTSPSRQDGTMHAARSETGHKSQLHDDHHVPAILLGAFAAAATLLTCDIHCCVHTGRRTFSPSPHGSLGRLGFTESLGANCQLSGSAIRESSLLLGHPSPPGGAQTGEEAAALPSCVFTSLTRLARPS